MANNYFNTTHQSGQTLMDFDRVAETQNGIVLSLMRKNIKLSPSEAWEAYCSLTGKQNTPLTSIRRSINTLTEEGRLVKTDVKKEGKYGRDEYVWRISC